MKRHERAALADVHKMWSHHVSAGIAPRIHCGRCGRYEPHHSRGMCAACYQRSKKNRTNP